MNKDFYDVAYKVLSHYLVDGIDHCKNFDQIRMDFDNKKYEVINYITEVRKNNIMDTYKKPFKSAYTCSFTVWKIFIPSIVTGIV